MSRMSKHLGTSGGGRQREARGPGVKFRTSFSNTVSEKVAWAVQGSGKGGGKRGWGEEGGIEGGGTMGTGRGLGDVWLLGYLG